MDSMDESSSPLRSFFRNVIYSPADEEDKISHLRRHIRHNNFNQNQSIQSKLGNLLSSTSNSFLLRDDDSFFSSDAPMLEEDTSAMLDYQMNSNYNDTNNGTTYYDYLPRNNSTIHFSVAFQVVIYIIYNTVFVAALLGNILVCYVVFSSPRMRTVTNYLIANLAIGDLLMALLCVPFSYISLLLQYWPFGRVLCHAVAPAQAVCVFVSAYTLVALAGDRYIAILYPLKPRLRRSQAVIVIFLVWTIAIITSLPIVFVTKLIYNDANGLPECREVWDDPTYKLIYSLALMILQYFFPLAVLIFTYTRIALAVWGKKAPGEAEDARDQRLAKAKRKMIHMMMAVVLVYSLCWLPINILVVYSDFDETIWEWRYMRYAFPIIQWLALAHTVCNPIIYCWMNSRFRAGFHSAISNVPLLKKVTSLGRTQSQQEYRLHRLNTCTTYTFVSGNGNNGKLARNSSLLSNGRKGSSPASFLRNHPSDTRDQHRLSRTSARSSAGLSTLVHYPNNYNTATIRINGSTTYQPIYTPPTSGRRKSSQNNESFM